jgi:hypothetical protein
MMTEPVTKEQPKAKAEKSRRVRVWCCYNADGSNFVLFSTELSALRYMAENHMDGCKSVEYGVPLNEQIG